MSAASVQCVHCLAWFSSCEARCPECWGMGPRGAMLRAQLALQVEVNRQLRLRVERLTGEPYEEDPGVDQTTQSALPKKFVYFESTEGGMEAHELAWPEQPKFLRGWMGAYSTEDCDLVDWMRQARVGDRAEHRLGVCVRVRS